MLPGLEAALSGVGIVDEAEKERLRTVFEDPEIVQALDRTGRVIAARSLIYRVAAIGSAASAGWLGLR